MRRCCLIAFAAVVACAQPAPVEDPGKGAGGKADSAGGSAEAQRLAAGSHAAFLGGEGLDSQLFEEYEDGSADAEYQRISDIFTDAILVLRRDYPNPGDVVKRDAHAKSHGCLKAKFTVSNEQLPANLRVGIYEQNKTYDAWVRFSNNHSNATRHDNIDDLRGMAIKLLDVPGDKILPDEKQTQTMDLLMFGSPVFFLKDSRAYGIFLDFINHGSWAAVVSAWEQQSLSTVPELIKGFLTLRPILKQTMTYTNPLNIPYFSSTPYRLGTKSDPNRVAMKFGIRRVACAGETFAEIPANKDDPNHPNYLRESLVAAMNQQDACFDLGLQIRSTTEQTGVEDPRIEWQEPMVNVARLTMAKQTFDTPVRNTYCENLSFTPWHALPEHRPLGRTNRARGILYNVISKHRHTENGVPRVEPTGIDEID